MSSMPNVTIIMVLCHITRQPYGVRLEEISHGVWMGDWAFAINENRAKREGYDRSEIRGTFGFTEKYPGCPYCRATGLVRCGRCGQLTCWNSESSISTCAKCGQRGVVSGNIDHLTAGGDV